MSDEISNAGDLLSVHGLKRTVARIAVLRHLLSSSVPQTAAQIEDGVAEHGFNQSTIYRTLDSLTEVGLVSQREFGDRIWRFEMRNENEPSHPHTLCLDCGRVQCLGAAFAQDLADMLPQGFRLAEIVFRGSCEDCAAQ